jgi:hypothetical protein
VLSRLILPGDKDTALLQWLLRPHPLPAFRNWLEKIGDPSRELQTWSPAQRGLLAHMGYVVRQRGLPAPTSFAHHLRTAEIHESFRAETYATILSDVVQVVEAVGERVLYVLGVPMDALYPREGLRHHGQCILALRSSQAVVDLARALRAAGYEVQDSRAPGQHVLLRHRSGFLVKVQVAFPLPAIGRDFERVYDDGRPWRGSYVRVPSLPDCMMEILSAATHDGSRRHLDWLMDAYYCCNRMQPDEFDSFSSMAEQNGLHRLVAIIIGFFCTQISLVQEQQDVSGAKEDNLSFPERLLLVSTLRAHPWRAPLALKTYAKSPRLLRHALWPDRDVADWFAEQKRCLAWP